MQKNSVFSSQERAFEGEIVFVAYFVRRLFQQSPGKSHLEKCNKLFVFLQERAFEGEIVFVGGELLTGTIDKNAFGKFGLARLSPFFLVFVSFFFPRCFLLEGAKMRRAADRHHRQERVRKIRPVARFFCLSRFLLGFTLSALVDFH